MAAATNARRLRGRPRDRGLRARRRAPATRPAASRTTWPARSTTSTSLVARTPREFRESQRIDVRTEHEVVDDRHRPAPGRGARPRPRPQLPHRVRPPGHRHRGPAHPARPARHRPRVGVRRADPRRRRAPAAPTPTSCRCQRVVVVGGGYIGLEMAEAFVMWGAEVTIVDAAPSVMRTLDRRHGALVVEQALERLSIDVRTGVAVDRVRARRGAHRPGPPAGRPGGAGHGRRARVRPWPARPASSSACAARCGSNRRQQTAVEGVWAAGDCAESFHLVSQRPVHVALGTVANRARTGGRHQHRWRLRHLPRRGRHRHHPRLRHRGGAAPASPRPRPAATASTTIDRHHRVHDPGRLPARRRAHHGEAGGRGRHRPACSAARSWVGAGRACASTRWPPRSPPA